MSSSLIERIKAAYIPSAGKYILGEAVQRKDAGAEWITQPNYYDWYKTIGEVLRPDSIGEIGVRYGYSLLAMALGAEAIAVNGWDLESYEENSVLIAIRNLKDFNPVIKKADTQKMDSLGAGDEFDLFHVDGDHSYGGAIHDCDLAWDSLKPGGVLIADDMCHTESTRDAVLWFAKHKGVECPIIPTYGGLAVMEKPL